MNVTVVALGKIGLPLAVQYARSGMTVVGADIDRQAIETISAGVPPFPGEAYLDTFLPDAIASGRLTFTTDTTAAVAAADVVVVVVPLVVDDDRNPDFRALDAATAAIAAGIAPGTLVVYETTLPVGTTRHRFAPALSARSGWELGTELFVAFSPERVYSGRIFADLRAYPKLVGGIDEASTRRAVEFYAAALQFDERADLTAAGRPNGVWDLGTSEASELAKLAETTYRDLNIAFANELARFSDANGIDVTNVIDACNTQPFSHIHRPGIAVGGHCIPVYPYFYLGSDPAARLPRVAREVNDAMPEHAVDLLQAAMGDLAGRRIAVLGAAYRGGVKETAFSGVFGTVAALGRRGAIVSVHDPLFTDGELRDLGFTPHHLGEPADGAVVQADHDVYRHLDATMLGGASVVVDGRRCVVQADGIRVVAIGGGGDR